MKTIAIISAVLALSIIMAAHSLANPRHAVMFATEPGVASSVTSATNVVKIENFSFSPAVLTVPEGTTVTWTNKDDIPHTVVQSEEKFKSKALDTDDSFSYTFTQPGTYEYFCSLHPKMTAKIVVEPK